MPATKTPTPLPPIYTFRVRILDCMAGFAPDNARDIQRDIEIAGNQTLADLGRAIPAAYGFSDAHLWSFFLSGKAWDTKTEYTLSDEDEDEDEDGGFGPPGLFPLPLPDDLDPNALIPAHMAIDTRTPLFAAFVGDFLTEMPATLRDTLRAAMQIPPPTPDAPLVSRLFVNGFLAGLPPDAIAELEMELRDAPADERDELFAAIRAELTDDITAELARTGALATNLPPERAGLQELFASIPPDALADLFAEEEPAGWADETLIRDVPYPGKTGKKEFLFLFDYGDEWRFGVKLTGARDTKTPRARYPRVVAERGDAPPQYSPWDDEDDEWDDEEDAESGDGPRTGIVLTFDPTTG